MTRLKFVFEKKGVEMVFEDQAAYAAWFSSLKDGKYSLSITRYRKTDRFTDPQFAYYYGVILPTIAEHTGDDDLDALDTDLKANFASYQDFDTGMLKVRRKSDMDGPEASLYIDRVIRWAGEFLGVMIPFPDHGEGL